MSLDFQSGSVSRVRLAPVTEHVTAALQYVTWGPEVENARQEEGVSDLGAAPELSR